MIVLNHTKQFFMQAGSNLNVLSTLYFSPQSILPLCTLESLNYECRSATLNFCKHFYSIGTYNIINPCQLRATSSIRLFFAVENRALLLSAPSLLFPSLLLFLHFFFSGKVVNLLLKGDLPCFQHFSIQERSLCSICSICHYEFWSILA